MSAIPTSLTSFAFCLFFGFASPTSIHAEGAPRAVKVVESGEGFQLERDGGPYFVKGAGLLNDYPAERLESLKNAGANSFRTWSVDEHTPELLKRANELGLTVSLGLWLAHPRHGFDYQNPDQVAAQFDAVRKAVQTYKDNPALLVWGIGNEVEEFPLPDRGKPGEDAAYWSHLEALAALIKRLDPNHPTMTTIAEVGGRKVEHLHRLCPSIDIVGINTYSRIATIAARYRAAGGTKPFLITEFGPRGHWECPTTPWGVPLEATSTEKAGVYRAGYAAIKPPENHPTACLGAYAFIWGNKQEATATWFGLHLPTGERLAGVDALEELWTGKPAENRVPEITRLLWLGKDQVKPGEFLEASLGANDPEGETLRISWLVRTNTDVIGLGGDHEAANKELPNVVVSSSQKGAKVKALLAPGAYRLFVYLYDEHGGAATGNLPFLVTAKK